MYTHQGIANAFPIGWGSGHGPLNHMHPLISRTLQRQGSSTLYLGFQLFSNLKHRPTPSDPYPLVRTLIRSNADIWKQYVRHDFVRQLGEGTLERERFLHFIK